MRISVIGAGYVGLVAGTCFADSGNDVVCVDLDQKKIDALTAGQIPIYEPGLEDLVKKNLREQRLSFTTDLAAAVSRSQVVFIAVGTPPLDSARGERAPLDSARGERGPLDSARGERGARGEREGGADLQYVLAAARDIGRALTGYTVVVDKSTVPVGTADLVRAAIAQQTKHPFDVVSNPEFLKEGAALDDFLKPDRVVIGSDSDTARKTMAELYAPFVRTENPILFMDTRSAELTKYASNAMLAARISFMNDVASLCEKVGADVDLVRKGMGADKRIGYPFLFPGVGYGGSCFGKDVKALVATAQEHGLAFELLRAVEKTNERQKRVLVEKATAHFGDLKGRAFAVWGLAFKPKTDDMRDAPSLEIIEGLLAAGAKVTVFDPVAMDNARRILEDRVTFVDRPYEALVGVDALFVVTEWNEFRHPDFERMRGVMKGPVVFDGRNIYSPSKMRELGFTCFGIGRK